MGFYIRKALRLGPVRLNLSKSGLGASVGVPGARIGLTASGRAYTHVGRYGVYSRHYFGSGGGSTARATTSGAGVPGAPVVLHEATGVTYAPDDAEPGVAALRIPDGTEASNLWPWLVAAAALMLVALLAPGSVAIVALVVVGAGGLMLAGRLRARRARNLAALRLRSALEVDHGGNSGDNGYADRLGNPDDAGEWQDALVDPDLTPAARIAELERAYLEAARVAVEDGAITEEEAARLEALERAGVPRDYAERARLDAFGALVLQVIADHEVSADEERQMTQVRAALRLSDEAADREQAVADRLAELRRIREGALRPVAPSVGLRDGEVCYFEAPGRLLKEKQLRRFQRDGQVYKVRGLVLVHEGRLMITDRRVRLVHEGSTAVPLDRILDVEVDLDRNLLTLTRDGVATPMLLSTPDAARAGAIISSLRGL